MLEHLIVRHFQCLDYLSLEFDPLATTITGPSRSGKTAALRALRWAAFNKPKGTHFVTHGETAAPVKLICDGGRRLLRKWSRAKGHAYLLDGKPSENVFEEGIPEAVGKALNVGPTNLQRQFDSHWFLSKTAGEVSRELNGIVDLGIIDRTLALVTSELKKAEGEAEAVKKRLRDAEKERDDLSWVPAYREKVTGLERKRELSRNLRVRAASLRELTLAARKAEKAAISERRRAEGLSRAVAKGEKALRARERAEGLRELLQLYYSAQEKVLLRIPDTRRLEDLYKKAVAARERANNIRKLTAELAERRKEEAEYRRRHREACNRLVEETGGTCPVCGGPLKKEVST